MAGRDHVCDAGAGICAHQAGGDDRHLRGPAASRADEAERDVIEELDHARLFPEGAEQDEEEDVAGGDERRNTVDALRAVGHVIDDLGEIVAAVIERGGQVLAEQAIGEEEVGDNRQRRPHQRPGGGEDDGDADDAEDDVLRQGGARAQQEVGIFVGSGPIDLEKWL